MNVVRSKSIEKLEAKMEGLDQDSLRYHILESAKSFKTSWIDLGRALYSVMKDKLYKEWGYGTFEIYTAKEIGIRKETAMKLLKSYYFLEKEEPQYLKQEFVQEQDAALVPSYEAVDVLRLAKAKKMDEKDYDTLKKEVFEKGKDAREVKKGMAVLIREREELEPEEAREKKKFMCVRRLIGTLKTLKQELEVNKLLSFSLVKDADALIKKLEAEISEIS